MSKEFAVPQALRGQVGELIFRLTFPTGEPARVSGRAQIWLDNIQLGPTGTPIMAEVAASSTGMIEQQFTVSTIATLLDATQGQWVWLGSGQNLVDVPDGSARVTLGEIGSPTASFLRLAAQSGTHDGANWDASFVQSSFNDQLFFADRYSLNELTGSLGIDATLYMGTDQTRINEDSSFTSNGHPVQAQEDSSLGEREQFTFRDGVMQAHRLPEAHISKDAAFVDGGTVGVPDVKLSGDFSPTPGGERSFANSSFLNPEHLTFLPFQLLPTIFRKDNGFVDFFGITSQKQPSDNYKQQAREHLSSSGLSLDTLPPDRNLANNSEANSAGSSFVSNNSTLNIQNSTLTAAQLALLNKATITIADLADGYLALTLGTTITLDTDAARYGWFIDPTPFINEEFVNGSSMVNGQSSPWQFTALDGSAASSKIDLMTVLMHELGHVMGLGHISLP